MSLGMFLLFPLFVRALGGSELTIGLVLGSGLALSVALRPVVGFLLDRRGRRRVLLASGAVNAASFPLFLCVHAPGPLLTLVTALHLIAGGALFAAYFTYVADLLPPGRRAEGIAIFGVAGMAPNGLGPALGEVVIARAGYPAFFLVATFFALLSLALTTLVPSGPPPEPVFRGRAAAARGAVATVILGPRLRPVLAATVLFGAGINAAFYFVAPFARDLHLARAAPFFAAYASTTIGLRIFARRLLDRLGAHRVAVPAFAVFAFGLSALALLPAPGLLVVTGIACGIGHGSLFPVLNALAVSRVPARLAGSVVSLYTAALDLGAVLGIPACGAIARTLGYRTMFVVMAAASLVGLVLMAVDHERTRPQSPA
jgi:MFS family permease